MGRYIVQSDIEDVFGVDNVALWSNLQNDDLEADTDRIATAIRKAEADVEARFRSSRYAIPFAALSDGALEPVKTWCAALAGVWLYNSRGTRRQNPDQDGNSIRPHKAAALEEMDAYLAGMRELDCQRKDAAEPESPFMVS